MHLSFAPAVEAWKKMVDLLTSWALDTDKAWIQEELNALKERLGPQEDATEKETRAQSFRSQEVLENIPRL